MAATNFEQPKPLREVGFTKIKGNKLTYSRVPKDAEGWANAKEFVPLKGDLVYLQMKDRQTIGWWGGAYWYGPRIKINDRVTLWKQANFEYD